MKLSFDVKSGLKGLTRQVVMALWLGLALLLLLVGWLVIRPAVTTLLNARHVDANPKTQLVRVNFSLYNSIAKRFEQEGTFVPTPVTAPNPFGIVETSKK